MTNDKFRQDVKNIINKGNNRQNLFVRALCLKIDRQVVLKSPVDKGTFKANWNVSFGSPDTSVTDKTDTSPIKTVNSSSASIIAANNKLKTYKTGTTVFITNSMPYAYRLEYEGWSKQAPQGMVRTTIAELNTILQEAGAEVKVL